MRRTIAATSLAERIAAQRRLAAAERDLLLREIERIDARRSAAAAREAELTRAISERRAALDRLVEETYRASRTTTLEALLRRGSIVDALVHVDDLSRLSAKHREMLDQLRADERRLGEERAAIARDEEDIAALQASVEAKDRTLRRLGAWAEALVVAARRGTATDAQLGLIGELAEATAREHEETERLIAEVARRAGETLPALDRWTWPVGGVVTQEFGPSTLALEPAMTYRGVRYAHFHDGIDIAAPLGSPVRAVARGRVAFVGHLSDGAMVVIVAHADGLTSLYGHLDDAALRPPVRAGDGVEAGQTIGAVGLTGLTTGPHIHFSLWRSTEPIDPRSVLSGDPREARERARP
jgi:murein DD-endopeptidase MepM/ murein hydrolase activator NlpD